MFKLSKLIILLSALVLSAQCAATQGAGNLPAPLKEELTSSRGVFVVPADTVTRKAPIEYWFVHQNGVIYVPSPVRDARVRRIQTGQTRAIISIGKADGPSFVATGAIVNDPKIRDFVFVELQKKYPDLWQLYGAAFRVGFSDGNRVLIKYTPADS